MMPVLAHSIAPWETALTALGFARSSRRAEYRRDGLLLTPQGRWILLQSDPLPTDADPLDNPLAAPGLWKVAPDGDGGFHRVFDLPQATLAAEPDDDGDDAEVSPLAACLSWALTTADGRPVAAWQPPPRDEVEAWLPPGGLTVQLGPVVRQGTLIHHPDRLALEFPVL